MGNFVSVETMWRWCFQSLRIDVAHSLREACCILMRMALARDEIPPPYTTCISCWAPSRVPRMQRTLAEAFTQRCATSSGTQLWPPLLCKLDQPVWFRVDYVSWGTFILFACIEQTQREHARSRFFRVGSLRRRECGDRFRATMMTCLSEVPGGCSALG